MIGTTCTEVLDYIDRKTRKCGKHIQFFRQIQAMTLSRRQSQHLPSMQRANSDPDFDPLGFDWMDGCFNEIFTGAGDNLLLDFTMNEEMFQIPDRL